MHRKQLLYFLLILLISALIWLLSTDKKSTITNDNNFSVSDTASVSKIFIADRSGKTITLDRTEKTWTVNNKYEVRKDAITTILNTIHQIRIQRPVPKESLDGVIKDLATTGVKVEIYTNKKTPIKTYTIGSPTSNHLGSYMLLNGAQTPFIVHIPSFNGFLSPRYGIQGQRLNEKDWRATTVFKFKVEDIIRVCVNNPHKSEQSFTLNTKPITLFNHKGDQVSFKQEKVLALLNSFRKLNCESFKEEYKLGSSALLYELIINNDTLRTYSFSKDEDNTDNSNVKRMYATLNNGELMLIQDYVFNKVLITIDELQ